jgi:multiple sugar transport system permease protein/putative aldouronate transport system permease protein
MAKIKNIKIKESFGDRVLNLFIGIILMLVTLIVGYPLLYVVSCSFSSSSALEVGSVILWPVDFTLRAYEFVLAYKQVWVGFRNSVMYVVLDVAWSMTTTILMAYPLSRAYLQGRKFYTMFFYMTTRFGAGLIPLFILKCDMGLYDNILAVLVTGGLAITNMLILRTAINSSIPGELHDAVMIDGANHFQTVFQLVLPLTKATLSVLVLYAIVGQWNEYFNSMIYLQNNQLFPLQLVLRPIMTAASNAGMDVSQMSSTYQDMANQGLENVRYALIIISTVPVVTAYFIVQKYFKGGVMMGSVKG